MGPPAVASGCASTGRTAAEIDGETAPDRNVEYLFYQTLVGAWPLGAGARRRRRRSTRSPSGSMPTMIKAVREGKARNPAGATRTTITKPRCSALSAALLDARGPTRFSPISRRFVAGVARAGARSTRWRRLVLKLTVPGVPDIYQGGELWDFSLVDPDNRRPVDWGAARLARPNRRRRAPADLGRGLAGRTRKTVRDPSPAWRCAAPIRSCLPRAIISRSRSSATGAPIFAPSPAVMTANVARWSPSRAWSISSIRRSEAADWGSTEIVLPREARWRDVLTGRTLDRPRAGFRRRAVCRFSGLGAGRRDRRLRNIDSILPTAPRDRL